MTALDVRTSVVLQGATPIAVRCQVSSFTGHRIVAAEIGVLTIQGDPEAMVALVDRLRSEVVAAVGKAWPVETAPALTRQCGLEACTAPATHKSGMLVTCEGHAKAREAENGCKPVPLATMEIRTFMEAEVPT